MNTDLPAVNLFPQLGKINSQLTLFTVEEEEETALDPKTPVDLRVCDL